MFWYGFYHVLSWNSMLFFHIPKTDVFGIYKKSPIPSIGSTTSLAKNLMGIYRQGHLMKIEFPKTKERLIIPWLVPRARSASWEPRKKNLRRS
jgi:hypothetical protein